MKGFFYLFVNSSKELKKITTITTTGMLMALAIALRATAITITPDIRIAFSFIALATIGMLFGPTIAGFSGFAIDVIGFLFDKTGTPFYPPLSIVAMLAGILFGIFLYQKDFSIIRIAISRICVVVICNIALNSYFIYTGFVNKDFTIFGGDLKAFFVWSSPRITKNLIMLPIEVILLSALLPLISHSYKTVKKTSYLSKR